MGGSELTAQGNSHPGPGTLVLEKGAGQGGFHLESFGHG